MTAVDGSPPVMVCHSADIRDRDGASDVTCRMLGTAPMVAKLWADAGYAGPRLKGGSWNGWGSVRHPGLS